MCYYYDPSSLERRTLRPRAWDISFWGLSGTLLFPLSILYSLPRELDLKLPISPGPTPNQTLSSQGWERSHLNIHFNLFLGRPLIACIHIPKGESPIAANFHLLLVGVVELHTLGHSLGLDLFEVKIEVRAC